MFLYHDRPASIGVENALRRAKQLAQLCYTPILPLPIVEKIRGASGERRDSANVETHSPAWLPLQGILYSSVRRTETYVGYNITPETFVTALSNPNSVMYKRPITGTGQNVHNYYGIVCSCFVSYCLNIHYRTNCARWPSIPGIHAVDTSELENVRLADVVLHKVYHIGIVTDIERDAEGKVRYISVTESTMPFIRTTRFSPEQFRNFWLANDYVVYRYDKVDEVPYVPDPFAPVEGDPEQPAFINRSLMPDFGNKANYKLGVDPVELSVFEEGCSEVEITDPDGEKTLLPVESGFVRVFPRKIGMYGACCVRAGGERSASVSWCVTDLLIEPEKKEYRFGEEVTVKIIDPAGDPIVAYQYNRRDTDKGARGGWLDLQGEETVTIPGPSVAVGVELYLIAKNAYGCYTSRRVPLEITES